MSATYTFTLEPARLPLHRGGTEGIASPVRSDTLMAALREVSAETGILARAFEGPAPPFLVSSVFFEVSGARLYPRPLAEPAAFKSLDRSESEFFRRIWEGFSLVTEARLESLAEGRKVRFESEDIIEERAWGMPSERSLRGLPRPSEKWGIGVDRRGGSVSRFSRSRAALPGGGRMFFLARLSDPLLLASLKDLVARLGEAGLGGGRSAGSGQFSLAGVHLSPSFLHFEDGRRSEKGPEGPGGEAAGGQGSKGAGGEPARRGPLLLLSLYLPAREEVARGDLEGMSGDAVVRGGWIQSSGPTAFRKRALRMLVEGTVLPGPRGPLAGEVRDVRPAGFEAHPVWRDGRALAISYGGGS